MFALDNSTATNISVIQYILLSIVNSQSFITFVAFCLYGTDSLNVTFAPKPIQTNIADLPAPFATQYINREATIVPIPSDPHLSIPKGFSIKLYMSDLIDPRLLLYTPTGDILVAEPNGNRISCLLDTDQRLTVAMYQGTVQW